MFGVILMRISIFIITVSALLAAAGCSRAPVLTIKNQSSLTLSNVVVSGTGFSQGIGSIPAGDEHRLTVRPRGDSDVRLVFDAGTNHVDSAAQGYFEAGGGYRVAVTVGTNLSVTVTEHLRSY